MLCQTQGTCSIQILQITERKTYISYMLDAASEQYLRGGVSIMVDSSVKTLMRLALEVSEKCRMH